MKLTIIGSTGLQGMMLEFKERMEAEGHEVMMPCFDADAPDSISVIINNADNIDWSDRVHGFWDQRSIGTVLDFGIVIALGKPYVVEYMEDKTIGKAMAEYAALTKGGTDDTL